MRKNTILSGIHSRLGTRSIAAGLLVLSAFLFTGCVSDSDDPDRILTSNHYTNKIIGLDFAFPPTWQAKLDQAVLSTKIDVVVMAPPIGNFSPNLNLIITAHSGPTAMQDILPLLESAVKGQIADVSGYTASIGMIDDKEVGLIDYESVYNGNLLHFSLVVFVNNNKDVVVTFTDSAANYPRNAEMAAIKASFHIVSR